LNWPPVTRLGTANARRRDDFSIAATGWQVAGATPDAAGHVAGSHRQVTLGPGRWLVFG